MNKITEQSFKELALFLKKPVKRYEVKKGNIDFPYSEFITIDGLLSEYTITELIRCIIERGKRKFILEVSKEESNRNIDEVVETWIIEQKKWLEKAFASSFVKDFSGKLFSVPAQAFPSEEKSLELLKKVPLIKNSEDLKSLIWNLFEIVLDKDKITLEIKCLNQINSNQTDLVCFIENPKPRVFLEIYNTLSKKGLVKADLEDFTSLFSGQKPKKKVVFESALVLQKLKVIMYHLGFRTKKNFSLESNFTPFIDFMIHKEKGDIAKQISNSSKNIDKLSEKSLEKILPDYQKLRLI